jgi:hypothetical protein
MAWVAPSSRASGVHVDGDDLLGAGDARALDGGQADAAAADHRHRHSRSGTRGVDGCSGAGQHTAAQQAHALEAHVIGNGDAAPRVHDRLLGEGGHTGQVMDRGVAGPQPGGSVDQRRVDEAGNHLEAEVRLSLAAEDAVAALGRERDHHAIARQRSAHAFAHFEHDPGGLVTQHHRQRRPQGSVRHREIAAADPARRDPEPHLPPSRSFQQHLLDRDGLADFA